MGARFASLPRAASRRSRVILSLVMLVLPHNAAMRPYRAVPNDVSRRNLLARTTAALAGGVGAGASGAALAADQDEKRRYSLRFPTLFAPLYGESSRRTVKRKLGERIWALEQNLVKSLAAQRARASLPELMRRRTVCLHILRYIYCAPVVGRPHFHGGCDAPSCPSCRSSAHCRPRCAAWWFVSTTARCGYMRRWLPRRSFLSSSNRAPPMARIPPERRVALHFPAL